MFSRGWNVLKGAAQESLSKATPTIAGTMIGGLMGISQAESLKGAAVKGSLGAVLGAVAINHIPAKYSPSEPSDWPAIDPKDEVQRSRDMQLKLRGLFWCTMLAGGAIEGILGIGPISTVVSSFGLIKTLLPIQEFNIAEDPHNIDGFAAKGVKKLDGILSKYSDSFDSQLGDRLLEIGAIMEQVEPRLGIILANRQLMKITQFGSPGMLGSMLSTGESIQNFFSFWSIKNNYFAITDALSKEKEKAFMDRQRPGSKAFTKKIEKKMWLKQVTARSIVTVAAASIIITLGIAAVPLLGVAAAAIGAKAVILSTAAILAIASTGYIGYSVLKGTSVKSISTILSAEKPDRKTPTGSNIPKPKLEQKTAKETTAPPSKKMIVDHDQSEHQTHMVTQHHKPTPGGFVDRLHQQRGMAPVKATRPANEEEKQSKRFAKKEKARTHTTDTPNRP